MNRREFLKLLGLPPAVYVVSSVSAFVPQAEALPVKGELGIFHGFRFIQTKEYGIAIPYADPAFYEENRRWICNQLVRSARYHMPREQRFELRKRMASDYGRANGVAWYRNKAMQDMPVWQTGIFEVERYNQHGGYYLIGRGIT